MKHFVLIVVLLLSACSPVDERINPAVKGHFETTEDLTVDEWHDKRNGQAILIGVVFNAIPALHLVGVWIDTFFVWWSMKTTIMGNGAIIAMKYDCPYLLQPEDYNLVLGVWSDSTNINEIATFYESFEDGYFIGNNVARLVTATETRQATKFAMKKLGAKVMDKTAGKIVGKYTIKVVSKKVGGFAPAVGPILAGGINRFMFAGPTNRSAERYFEMKASVMCPAHPNNMIPLTAIG